jgi:hypothetical protein
VRYRNGNWIDETEFNRLHDAVHLMALFHHCGDAEVLQGVLRTVRHVIEPIVADLAWDDFVGSSQRGRVPAKTKKAKAQWKR